ncbi:Tripeptidyl aminopeptidase precursor [Brevundimonas diminuta]|jgi:pimeloyl-ACP methyl ester carboxylesterase|uniref:alpha/beta fold hydrolase n=1 Tax=Brevundimonas diminuta TaxID=293 RepID=UPI000D814CC8|nr:alpha/beta hydrolase [Brevundimonas diminuta]SPU43469.1 Tripeptidyl aminopeptidase precursor [Brevundimonas diminuta]
MLMPHTFLNRRSILAAASLALPGLALLSNTVLAQEAQPEAGPFRFKAGNGEEVDAERGFFEVPEDRRIPGSRRIRIGYVRFASTSKDPGPPIIYLAGGPGGSGPRTAMGPRFPIFMALREVADVIALDQRGVGLSSHIPDRASTTPFPAMTHAGVTAWYREEMQKAWIDWTRAGVAMTGYNTEQNADDIEDLRRHLGVEKVNLWGISYGTHLALSVLKRHPNSIGRVAMASLEGQDQTIKRPAHIDLFLDRVDHLMGQDPAVRAAIPNMPALMRRVHERLEADPATVAFAGENGPVDVKVGGFGVQLLASALVANPPQLAMLPGIYLALDAGKTDILASIIPPPHRYFRISGMSEAMDMASGVSPARLALISQEAKTAVLGDAFNMPMPHLLNAIPSVDLGDDFRAPIRIETPAMLVAGSLDGRTPLEEQAEVIAQFQNKTQVLVENAGHNVFEAHPEVQSLLVKFFSGAPAGDTRLTLPPPTFPIS